MVWIDYAIIIIIGFSCLVSLIRGFVCEALSLISWWFAFFIASRYYVYLSTWLTFIENEVVRNVISIAILFIAILTFGTVINHRVGQLVKKTGISKIDRVLGIFFGALRGVLVITVILFFLDTFTGLFKIKDLQKSQLVPYFIFVVRWFFDYLQSSSNFLTDVLLSGSRSYLI